MRTRVLIGIAFFGCLTIPVHAASNPAAIDRFHFLAGLSVTATGCIDPPQCGSFYREGGELRVAEIFLDVARTYNENKPTYYFVPRGKRLVVEHRALSEALRVFYVPPDGTGFKELDLIHLDRQKRLSFVAGIYARCFRDGAFHGPPSPAMRATVLILLAEECEVSHLVFSEHEVPDTMHFRVKPSKRVAEFFAAVDEWKAPHVQWKQK